MKWRRGEEGSCGVLDFQTLQFLVALHPGAGDPRLCEKMASAIRRGGLTERAPPTPPSPPPTPSHCLMVAFDSRFPVELGNPCQGFAHLWRIASDVDAEALTWR